MPGPHEVDRVDELVDRFATVNETAAHAVLTEGYGLVAKTAAAELVVEADFDEEATDSFMRTVSDALHGLDFPERRQLADHLNEAAKLIGKGASRGVVRLEAAADSVDDEQAVRLVGTTHPAQDAPAAPAPETGSSDPEDPDQATAQPTPAVEILTDEERKLRKRYGVLLVKVFGKEAFETIPTDKLGVVLEAMLERYLRLKIPRSTAENKQTRVDQMRRFVAGESFQEISITASQAVNTALRGIVARVDAEELQSILTDALVSTDTSEVAVPRAEAPEIIEDLNLEDARASVVTRMKAPERISDIRTGDLLEALLDPDTSTVLNSHMVKTLRGRLRSVINQIVGHSEVPEDLRLTEDEGAILHAIFRSNDPQTVKQAVKNRAAEAGETEYDANGILLTILNKLNRILAQPAVDISYE